MAGLEADRPPKLTANGKFLSTVFLDLRVAQGGGGMGPGPIGWGDVKAYCDLMRLTLSPWSLRLIRMADSVFLEWAVKEKGEK